MNISKGAANQRMAKFEIIVSGKRRTDSRTLNQHNTVWRLRSIAAAAALLAVLIGLFIAAVILGFVVAALVLILVVIAFAIAVFKAAVRRARQ